jgi:DNA-binding winged helix-turn-helix (wHTH) protein
MGGAAKHIYAFGPFRLDGAARVLVRDGRPVTLAPWPFEILLALVENPGYLFTRTDLKRRVWPGGAVDDSTFEKNLSAVLNALDEPPKGGKYIEVAGEYGIRFIAQQTTAIAPSPPPRPPPRIAASKVARQGAALVRDFWKRWMAGRGLSYGLLALGVGIIGLAIYLFIPRREPVERQLTMNPADAPVTAAALSPDGKSLAYADERGVYLKTLASGENHSLHFLPGLRIERISWFPDGASLLVSGADTRTKQLELWTVSIAGGAPQKFREDAAGATVSRDGSNIAFTNSVETQIWIIGARARVARNILSAGEADFLKEIEFSPDGRRLFYNLVHMGPDRYAIRTESVDLSGEHAAVLSSGPDITVGVILPDGRMIYARREQPPAGRDFNLWVIKVNPRTGKRRSSPRRLTAWTGVGVHSLSISADGKRLAYVKTAGETPGQAPAQASGQANVWLLENF